MAKRGRPSIFDPKYIKQVATLIAGGWSQKETMDLLCIPEPSWKRWRNMYPEFQSAIETSRGKQFGKVMDALTKSAVGYQYEEVSHSTEIDEQGNEKITTKKTIKYKGPNVSAIRYYTNNRAPKKYRDGPQDESANAPPAPPLVINYSVNAAIADVRVTKGKKRGK